MKRISITFLIIVFTVYKIFAQVPQGINYQAVARDNSGNVMAYAQVQLSFSILRDNPNGAAVYSETFSVATNAYGLINVVLGQGKASTGTFDTINWGESNHFLSVKLNGVLLGTSQLLSVPYAMLAQKTSPAEQILSIPSTSFAPNNNNASFDNGIGQGGTEINTPGAGLINRLVAPVILPHGAVINEITAYYKNNSTATLSLQLTSEYLNTGSYGTSIALGSTSTAANTWISTTTKTNFTIDNSTYGYSIFVNCSDWTVAGEKYVKGIRIKYTY